MTKLLSFGTSTTKFKFWFQTSLKISNPWKCITISRFSWTNCPQAIAPRRRRKKWIDKMKRKRKDKRSKKGRINRIRKSNSKGSLSII